MTLILILNAVSSVAGAGGLLAWRRRVVREPSDVQLAYVASRR